MSTDIICSTCTQPSKPLQTLVCSDGHVACIACLNTHFAHLVKTNPMAGWVCCQPTCKKYYDSSEIHERLPNDLVTTYEKAIMEQLAEIMEQQMLISKEKKVVWRNPLPHYRTLDDAVRLIQQSKKIVILAGAGISVSCGIPDFRSKDGFYAQLEKRGINPPERIFSLPDFMEDPTLFYQNSGFLYAKTYIPSITHFFLSRLEHEQKLQRLFTQNIDFLEGQTGVSKLIQVHGSLGTFFCVKCKAEVPFAEIEEKLNGTVLYCSKCKHSKNVMKPSVVFFGEGLPEVYFRSKPEDLKNCDLMIVTGTSLTVSPVNALPEELDKAVPRILVNREIVGRKGLFDIHLLGNIDTIFMLLAKKLGWALPCEESEREQALKVAQTATKERKSVLSAVNTFPTSSTMMDKATTLTTVFHEPNVTLVSDPATFNPEDPPYTYVSPT
ncbi:putative NAD-dependent protein deacetylase sir-2.1 [Blattamonas nauphoetae]|uniref:NAD-dependent protein deacetylase sir-2.1 n=1 Tax=Blattamonas nauphoetae TaxID=2049346 RepID=A0ABQ9XT59_9EUKA|nr:putative NAD-dependent protein deacetylase sir-2.1 [Blattamonas nauphoetae]